MRPNRNFHNNIQILLFVPLTTYIVSYGYLGFYHGRFNLVSTVIHEGGKYTLLQSIFYASHFLGHIPMISILALYFVGIFLCIADESKQDVTRPFLKVHIILILIVVVGSLITAVSMFGYDDTLAFISQKKQAVRIYETGGSWNLHLPSSLLLVFFIPVYIYCVLVFFRRKITISGRGRSCIITALAFMIIFTIILNHQHLNTIIEIMKSPRYLSHSVRELMTFPLTYFPLPLYFFLKQTKATDELDCKVGYMIPMGCLAMVFIIGLGYQSYVSLSEGIGNLAQKPSFAKGEQLNIPYLITSHYFEHFSDTIFFCLFSLILMDFRYFCDRKTGRLPLY